MSCSRKVIGADKPEVGDVKGFEVSTMVYVMLKQAGKRIVLDCKGPPNKQNAGELLIEVFLKVGLAAIIRVVVGSLAHPQSPDFGR